MSRTKGVLLCLALLLAACKQQQGMPNKPEVNAALNAIAPRTPVGPVPGIGEIRTASNPYGNDRAAAGDGRQFFVDFNCSGCHGGHGGGGMGPSLRDRDWIYGSSDAQIYDSIASGRAHGMPAWGARLPQQVIWRMVTYIQSLGTDHEAQPPT